jgi:hypothetical protein
MPKLSDDTKLTVLNDHYNNTVTDFKKLNKTRDTNFLFILILLGVMAFQYVSPSQSQSVLVQAVQKKLEIDAAVSINVIGSLVWFALLYVAIRYFQNVINIEKQYNYTHQLEKELAKHYDGKAFTREGKAYLNNYAIFSDWVHIVYWYIFPVLFTAVITVKIVGEWAASSQNALQVWLNTAIYASLVVSTALYVFSLYRTKKNSEKDVKNK